MVSYRSLVAVGAVDSYVPAAQGADHDWHSSLSPAESEKLPWGQAEHMAWLADVGCTDTNVPTGQFAHLR
jgi:hypothetical protein